MQRIESTVLIVGQRCTPAGGLPERATRQSISSYTAGSHVPVPVSVPVACSQSQSPFSHSHSPKLSAVVDDTSSRSKSERYRNLIRDQIWNAIPILHSPELPDDFRFQLSLRDYPVAQTSEGATRRRN